MLRRVLVAFVGSFVCALSAGAADSKVFDLPYLMRDLPNGLRVVVVKTDYPDVVTLQIPVFTGSRNEVEPGKSGFAHFFEHMMFRGTTRFPAAAYESAINAVGGDQNAFTSDDITNYHVTFTKADLERVLDVEADRFMNLKYSEEQFKTESLAVKGEYLKNYSNPNQKISETMRELMFTAHSYGHTTMGYLRDIDDMPNQMEYSRIFFDRWYRPENASVIIVGDIDPEATFKLVEKYFGSWKRGNYKANVPAEPAPSAPKAKHIKWDAPTQAYLTLGFRAPALRTSDRELPAVDLVGEVWFGETSELYQKLVVKERWVDTLYFAAPNHVDPYLINIVARLIKPEFSRQVNDAIADTLVRARTERVSVQRLADIKSALKYGFVRSLDNSAAIGGMLARNMVFDRSPETINRIYAAYDALTPEEIRAAADRYIVDKSRVQITLSNSDSLPGSEFGLLDGRVAAINAVKESGIATLERKGSSPLISVNLLFATGAAFDPPGKKGLAQLTAAMMTDAGSQARSYRELTAAREPIAADFNAQVDKEMVSLRGTVHRDNLDKWSGLALEQLLTPGFDAQDFQRVKITLINAIRSNLRGNNDEELAKETLYESVYGPSHPYGTLTLGDVSDIEKLTLDDVRQFHAAQFTRANLTFAVAGNYDATWLADFKRELGKLPAGARQSLRVPKPAPIDGRRAVVIQKETPSVAVSFGFPIDVKRGDRDWVALWLVRSWLGEHRQGGHLFERIREVRGMNYGDYAYIEYFPRGMFQFFADPNLARSRQLFQIWIRPLRDNNDAVFATRVALYELDKLIKNGLSAAEFKKQRQYMEKFVSQMSKTQSQQLGGALDSRFYGIADFPDYVRTELAKLTVGDVNRVVRKYLQTDNVQLVFVAKDAQDLSKRLTSDAASSIKYPAPKPELSGEDALIGRLPLRLSADKVSIRPAEQVFE